VEGLRKFARDSHPSARSRTGLLDEAGRDLLENADWHRQWDVLNRLKRPGDVETEIRGGMAQFGVGMSYF